MPVALRQSVASEVLKRLPSLAVVLEQVHRTQGPHRTRGLQWLSGEKRTHTVHAENGCRFIVDLRLVYFSPRLSYERLRITHLARGRSEPEVVLNMFAGVGCFSILIARACRRSIVYSMDVNPHAVNFMLRNIRMNRSRGDVVAMLGDSRTLTERFFLGRADRVLLPLPEKSMLYLETAIAAIKEEGGMIHVYDFVRSLKGDDPLAELAERIHHRLSKSNRHFKVHRSRIVRSVGPRLHLAVADIEVI